MEPTTAFLISMQAAGLVVSAFGKKSQRETIRLGQKLQQEQFSTNIQALRTESAQSSLDELKQVRQNIGSQIVANAALGNRGGSSYLGIAESMANFENDERRRRLNLLAKESQLRANEVLTGLHTLESETALGQSLMRDIFNTLPVSGGIDKLFNSNKKTNNNATANSGGNFNWGY